MRLFSTGFEIREVTRPDFHFCFEEETLPHKHTHNHPPTHDYLIESRTQNELAVQNQLRIFYFKNIALLFNRAHLKSQ